MERLIFLSLVFISSTNLFAAEAREALVAKIRAAVTPDSGHYNEMFYFKVVDEKLRKYVGSRYVTIVPTSYISPETLFEGEPVDFYSVVLRAPAGVGSALNLTEHVCNKLKKLQLKSIEDI